MFTDGDAADAWKSRVEYCSALEELRIRYSWILSEYDQRKYNPIKEGRLGEKNSGQDDGEGELVNSFCKLIIDYGIDFRSLVKM